MSNLPQNQMREANLAFLRTRASFASMELLADKVSVADDSDCSVSVASDGSLSVVCCRQGNNALLHSRRDPLGEAFRQLKECHAENKVGCIVFGVAGGYHLQALAEILAPDSLLIVIDLFPARVAAVLPYLDLTALEYKGIKTAFIVNSSIDAARREFRHLLHRQTCCDFAFFIQPGLWRVDAESWRNLSNEIKEEVKLEITDRATRAVSANEWLNNAVRALPLSLSNPQADALANCFNGGTAIVVAAGPTLTEATDMIKRLSAQCPVIAVGTAVKPLIRAGIVPDIIVVLDSHWSTINQIPETGTENSFLVASYSAPLELSERFNGRIFSYSFSGMAGFNQWLAQGGRRSVLLNVGGTVSLTAIDLAILTGCTAIILCGLDLAMADNGATHAGGSMYDGQKLATESLVRVPGNYHDSVPTTPQFAGYIRQMNAYLTDMTGSGEINFFNATTGGALLEKTTVIRPELLMSEAIVHGIPAPIQIMKDIHAAAGSDCALSADYLRTSVSELQQIAAAANAAAELIAASGDGITAAVSAQLTELELKMRKLRVRSLLDQALEAITMELSGTDTADLGKKCFALYRAIAAAAAALAAILADTLNTIGKKFPAQYCQNNKNKVD